MKAALLVLVTLPLWGCKQEAPVKPTEPVKSSTTKPATVAKAEPACGCAEGKKGGTVWCDKCKKGYIKGTAETDKAKVLAAAAHAGHDHGACGCAEGKKGGTVWCDKCKKGYIEGKVETDKTKVLAAAEHAGHDHGACGCAEGKKGGTVWCDKCNKGFIEGKVETDKAKVAAAIKTAN